MGESKEITIRKYMKKYEYEMFLPGGEHEGGTLRAASEEDARTIAWERAVRWTKLGDWGKGWTGTIPVHYRVRLDGQEWWPSWQSEDVSISPEDWYGDGGQDE